MKKTLNKLIIFSACFLGALYLVHIDTDIYYNIDGGSEAFIYLEENPKKISITSIYISIKEKDEKIECGLSFVGGFSDILIDSLEIDILSKNEPLELEVNFTPNLKIGKGTSYRIINKVYKINNPDIEDYNLNLHLKYKEGNEIKLIELNELIERKKYYTIRSWDMHDPTMLLIDLLNYIVAGLILIRIIIQFVKKNNA